MRKERWREGKRTRANKNERQECFFPRRERLRGLEREFNKVLKGKERLIIIKSW